MGIRVLIVDDTPANVRLLKNKLRSRYFEVDTAESGEEALSRVQTSTPDVIILDVMMPGLNGYDTCRALKSTPSVAQIPVVLLTSLTDQNSRNDGLAAGADDFLSRPIDDEALFQRVTALARVGGMVRQLESQVQTVASLSPGEGPLEPQGDIAAARILLADPDDDMRAEVRRALQPHLPVEIIELSEPLTQAGLPPAASGDLLIINVDNMPSDHAFYTVSQFIGREGAAANPALALSNASSAEKSRQAERSGLTDSVDLPFDALELRAKVRSHLRRSQYVKRLKAVYAQAIDAALTDELTGLYNRRFASSHIEQAIQQGNSDGRRLALMMIDLDDFKQINDGHGHEAGDEALTAIAAVLKNTLRQQDMVARWGGDEFLVLLPEIEAPELAEVGQRLLKAASKIKFGGGWRPGKLSLSIGAAISAGDDSADWLEVIRQADRALYRVKERGKSGVEISNQ